MLECPNASKLIERMLQPEFAPILESFAKRVQQDPGILEFHQFTVVLELRRYLGLNFTGGSPCEQCSMNSVMNCRVLGALKETLYIHNAVMLPAPVDQRRQFA